MRMLALSLSKVQGSLLISLSMPLSLGMTIYWYTIIYVSIYICVCVCTRTHACVCVCMCACVAGNSIQSVFLHLSIFPPFFFLSLFSFSLLCWFQTGPSWPDDTPMCIHATERQFLDFFEKWVWVQYCMSPYMGSDTAYCIWSVIESQSTVWSRFNRTWQKRLEELDHRLKLESEEMILQVQ